MSSVSYHLTIIVTLSRVLEGSEVDFLVKGVFSPGLKDFSEFFYLPVNFKFLLLSELS